MVPDTTARVTWANLIGGFMAASALAAAVWTILQVQFGNTGALITGERADRMAQDIVTNATIVRRFDEANHHAEKIDAELLARRQEFVPNRLLDEVTKRLDADVVDLRAGIARIEITRPTTGELERSASAAATERTEIKERLRSLEDYLRTAKPQGAAPPHQ